MRGSVCSLCGSKNLYRSIHNAWSSEGVFVAVLGEKTNDVFPTRAHLCLDCRHLDLFVEETAAAVFGKGIPLHDAVSASNNWEKVSD